MFANTLSGVMNLGVPDVCNVVTPAGPVPTPFVNIAVSTASVPNVFNVILGAGLAENLLTQGTVSSGDEAGAAMGVASGTIVGPCRHLLGSFKVFMGTAPCTRLTSTTLQNSTNAPGLSLTPSQVTTLVLA